jgi:copper chaperone
MERLALTIDGMSCGHCVAAVTGALKQLPGVAVEQVDIGAAVVSYDPAKTSPDQIIDAVNDEGYSAYRAAVA